MIPKDHITAWRAQAPWPTDAQVEQDLVISRAVVEIFERYMREDGLGVTRAQFEENLARKGSQPDFRDDVRLLLRPGLPWNIDRAMTTVLEQLVAKLPGEPWKGAVS